MYSSNQRVPIELDADLVAWLDEIIGDWLKQASGSPTQDEIEQKRIEASETAVRDWCKQQAHERLQRSADLHRQRHNNDETGWLD